MNTSRRQLLQWALGAAQVGLLSRYNLLGRPAWAANTDVPTKLITFYVYGGNRPYFQWWPLEQAQVDQYMPPPGGYDGEVAFFSPDKLVELAPGDGAFKPLRMFRSWDTADPSKRDFQNNVSPLGYGWSHFGLANQTSVLHGIDQGTNAHQSGYIASMCGVAGGDYRAPAVQSVVANALQSRFASTRPLPCVAIDARGMPVARGLPAEAAPILVPQLDALKGTLSAKPADNAWWTGLDDRSPQPELTFAGTPTGRQVGMTGLEAKALAQVRALKGHSNAATDAALEQLHDGLQAVSGVLAADVVSVLSGITPVEHLAGTPYLSAFAGDGSFGYHFGLANFYMTALQAPLEMALRLVKSDLTSAIHVHLPAPYFDTHNGSFGVAYSSAHGRAVYDVIARFCGELKNTPAPGLPGKTMLDDTLVMVFSEFARPWPSGTSQSNPSSWQLPDDHHPFTSVTYIGGNVAPNHMVGTYEMPSGRGGSIDLIEENGQSSNRPPRAADATTTALRVMGLGFSDFFIPGGYGEAVGIRRG